jgi:hypothetical protein
MNLGLCKCSEIFNSMVGLKKSNLNQRMSFLYFDTEKYSLDFFVYLNFIYINFYKYQNIITTIITDYSVVSCLNPGMNKIYISNSLFTKKGVGLLPISKSIISTKGFKWDIGIIYIKSRPLENFFWFKSFY